MEDGVGKVRCKILKQQVENHGGCVASSHETSTHVFVSKGLKKERLVKCLGGDVGGVVVLQVEWLSACLTKKQLLPHQPFQAYPVDDEVICVQII